MIILNIFSELVLAETLPNPTLVKLEHVKYSAVMYDSEWDTLSMSTFNFSANVWIQPVYKHIIMTFSLFLNYRDLLPYHTLLELKNLFIDTLNYEKYINLQFVYKNNTLFYLFIFKTLIVKMCEYGYLISIKFIVYSRI